MGIPDFQKLDKWEDTPRPKTRQYSSTFIVQYIYK